MRPIVMLVVVGVKKWRVNLIVMLMAGAGGGMKWETARLIVVLWLGDSGKYDRCIRA